MTAISSRAGTQLRTLAWICFCCPGLFNALLSLAGGLEDPRVAFAGTAIVTLSFAVCGLVATALVPALGLRLALTLGAAGYAAYVAALWNVQSGWVVPLPVYFGACAALGLASSLLWTAQGAMIMTYSSAEARGASVGSFWTVFNLGATTGGLLGFALNFNNSAAVHTSSGMYAAFLAVMVVGVALAWGVIRDADIILSSITEHRERELRRVDVTSQHRQAENKLTGIESLRAWWASWGAGARNAWDIVSSRTHRKILLALLPLFAYSNWFYAYSSFYNISVFNARTSGLTSACYWLGQTVAASVSGRYLDNQMRARREKGSHSPWGVARQYLLAYCLLVTTMWSLGWFVQSSWLHLSYEHRLNMDILTTEASRLLPALGLYIVYGLHDAVCQVWIYWFMGQVTGNDVPVASCYAGVYKSVQSTSAAVAWYFGAIQMTPVLQLQINFGICVLGVAGALTSCRYASQRTVKDADKGPGERTNLLGDA